eukprot:746648-Hanusia_phi.AAC.5
MTAGQVPIGRTGEKGADVEVVGRRKKAILHLVSDEGLDKIRQGPKDRRHELSTLQPYPASVRHSRKVEGVGMTIPGCSELESRWNTSCTHHP